MDEEGRRRRGVMVMCLVALVYPCVCGVTWRVPLEVLRDDPMYCPVCGGREGAPSPEMAFDEAASRPPSKRRHLRPLD